MAQIQKGTTYSTGDQVTATNLNALADAAILLPGAITDQTAKTVPLAADTVLIHSAADTALRKSTLTQLFANATGIPISTGISGLGTGIATALAINTGSAGAPVLFNGALGTPSSGTVTNLTGTASININGTVGATTANTGAFTTLSASGKITSTSTGELFLSNTATTQALYLRWLNTGGNLYFGRESSAGGTLVTGAAAYSVVLNNEANQPVYIASNNAIVGTFSSTGLAVTGVSSATSTAGGAGFSIVRTGGAPSTFTMLNSGGEIIHEYNAVGYGFNISTARVASITSTGLGIGTTSPVGKLQVTGSSASFVFNTSGTEFYNTNAGTVKIYAHNAAGALALSAGGRDTGDLFINSSGNVGIGTTSPAFRLHVYTGSGSSVAGTFETNQTESYITFRASGTSSSSSCRIGVTGENILFLNNGANERARIDSNGNLLVGTTSAGGKLVVTQTASSTNAILVDISSSTTKFAEFTFTGSNVGSISYNGTLTVYSTTSDYRLKDITGPLTDSGAFIDALKPKVGTWKESGKKFVGFVAHEFAEVSPSSVSGEKDAVDNDGKPIYQSMQASSAEVIANLVAELQSLRQRVAALESN